MVNNNNCPDMFGCDSSICPDFTIKRHDTKPSLTLTIKDCSDPVDTTDCAVEVSMWANAKLKKEVLVSDTYFAVADNIGFYQMAVGDIILVNRVRNPELMLVKGFDENNNLVEVERGYRGSVAGHYKKGTGIKIFRILNGYGSSEMTYEDITQIDGTVNTHVLTESKLVYNWQPNDTCLPGCYFMEFRLVKLATQGMQLVDPVNFYTLATTGCEYGPGLEWMRRYPSDKEGFIIQIFDSPVSDNIL